ncbi:Protein CBG01292 [Caenorhabditis briggsae]|uniref:Protein CBG01292 n=1 Tax=Caenorhabditis briggsae TaxID=6238 RepID=A8WQ23_CAEBR|nr:Protein CBG01292 [Caenorhabditis briggsae]CAP22581.2 Protein CBG01292 [Caenorhabditis briggsae]
MIIYGLSLTQLYNFLTANHWLTFMVVWPVSASSNVRAVLIFIIALDRTCAAYCPTIFSKYRKLIPTVHVIFFVSSFLVIETLIAFHICKIDLNIPTDCIEAQFINGACYHNYWITFSKILYTLIIALTFMLCLKIFFWDRYKKQHVNENLRRMG